MSSATLSDSVPSGGTVGSHRLRYALCGDDGMVEANVGGEKVLIRAVAAVWCGGADGKTEPYSSGRKGDDIYSWSHDRVVSAK